MKAERGREKEEIQQITGYHLISLHEDGVDTI
jgi:hypothetical protein